MTNEEITTAATQACGCIDCACQPCTCASAAAPCGCAHGEATCEGDQA